MWRLGWRGKGLWRSWESRDIKCVVLLFDSVGPVEGDGKKSIGSRNVEVVMSLGGLRVKSSHLVLGGPE